MSVDRCTASLPYSDPLPPPLQLDPKKSSDGPMCTPEGDDPAPDVFESGPPATASAATTASPAPVKRDLFRDRPIYPGEADAFHYEVEHKRMMGIDLPEIERDDSYRELTPKGLGNFLRDLNKGPLTQFESHLVAGWGKDPSTTLIPIFERNKGVAGYEQVTGGSGDRVHEIFTRTGEKVGEFHTEAALVNEGLGPIDYAFAAAGVVGAGKLLFGAIASRRAAGALAEGVVAEVPAATRMATSAEIGELAGLPTSQELATLSQTELKRLQGELQQSIAARAERGPMATDPLYVQHHALEQARLEEVEGLLAKMEGRTGPRPGELPSFDRNAVGEPIPTGRVHTNPGERLPTVSELRRYSPDELRQLQDELRASTKQRTANNQQHGYHAPHAERLAEEQKLIRQIDKILEHHPEGPSGPFRPGRGHGGGPD